MLKTPKINIADSATTCLDVADIANENYAFNPSYPEHKAPQHLLDSWQKVYACLKDNKKIDMSGVTNQLRLAIYEEKMQNGSIFTDNGTNDKIGYFEPMIDQDELLKWMDNCDWTTFYIVPPLAERLSYDYYKFINTFQTVSGIKDLGQNNAILIPLLKLQLEKLAKVLSGQEPGKPLPNANLAYEKLVWILNSLVKSKISQSYRDAISAICAQAGINELSLWAMCSSPSKAETVVTKLKKLCIIDDVQQQTGDDLLRNITASEVYELLANNPARLLTKVSATSIDEHVRANCLHEKYKNLDECHCSKYTRGAFNFRDTSEKYLVDILSQYEGKTPRIAVVGAGNLFQVAVIVAKVFSKTKITRIDLDLLDPGFFFGYDRNRAIDDFIKLLIDCNFNLAAGKNADEIFGRSPQIKLPTTYSPKGRIEIEFYSNKRSDGYYQKAADILFINDGPLEGEFQDGLDAANHGASLILVDRVFVENDLDKLKVMNLLIKRKHLAGNTWAQVLSTGDCKTTMATEEFLAAWHKAGDKIDEVASAKAAASKLRA